MRHNVNIVCCVNYNLSNAKSVHSGPSEHADNQHLLLDDISLPFTGKEIDSETGLYYFGARYYDPALSGLFISVDPMSDKYPNISPYAYCAWNPVKLVDLNGMDTIVSINIENGNINMATSAEHNRGCIIQYLNNETDKPIKEYVCAGHVFFYKRGETSIIDFGDDHDAEDVYNQLSWRNGGDMISSVEWNLYDNLLDIPTQLITSQKRDEIDVSCFKELAELTKTVRHYQPYYSDLEYSLPSTQDINYARDINTPCYLDYCGRSYRFDNLVPCNIKRLTVGIIRRFVKSKIIGYEGFCN